MLKISIIIKLMINLICDVILASV